MKLEGVTYTIILFVEKYLSLLMSVINKTEFMWP